MLGLRRVRGRGRMALPLGRAGSVLRLRHGLSFERRMLGLPGSGPANAGESENVAALRVSRRLIELVHSRWREAAAAGFCGAGALLLLGIFSWGQVGAALVWAGLGLQFLASLAFIQSEPGDGTAPRSVAPYLTGWGLVLGGLLLQLDRIAATLAGIPAARIDWALDAAVLLPVLIAALAAWWLLLPEQRRLGTVDLLVRARHNRSQGPGVPKLFDAVRAEPAQARMEIHVGRLSARRGSRGQKGSEVRAERVAQVGLRWQEVELRAAEGGAAGVKLNLVHVLEETEPEGAERLEWFLLTTLGVETRQEAERVLEWYRLRWRIEDWHRVLKAGCKVEYLGHRTGERIERAVTIKAVIAWRLTAMTLLGRDTPELPPETLFTDIEINALEDFAQDRKLAPPDNLGRAVLTMAILGGYLNFKRKTYAAPGHKIIWEGCTRLTTTAQSYERALRLDKAASCISGCVLTRLMGKRQGAGLAARSTARTLGRSDSSAAVCVPAFTGASGRLAAMATSAIPIRTAGRKAAGPRAGRGSADMGPETAMPGPQGGSEHHTAGPGPAAAGESPARHIGRVRLLTARAGGCRNGRPLPRVPDWGYSSAPPAACAS